MQTSLRDSRLILEDSITKLDTLSRDDVIDSFKRALDLNKEWDLKFPAYSGFDPSDANYVKKINQFYEDGFRDFEDHIKNLDHDALKQTVKDNLYTMIRGINNTFFNIAISG